MPSNIMQIQLLGKDDISTDDATTLTERWRHYIESYTLVSCTHPSSFSLCLFLCSASSNRRITIRNQSPLLATVRLNDDEVMKDPHHSFRSIRPNPDVPILSSAYISRARLQIKVCIRTYRLFFVGGTEDFYWRRRSDDDVMDARAEALERKVQKKKVLDKWLDVKISASNSKFVASEASSMTTSAIAVSEEPSTKQETNASEDIEMMINGSAEPAGRTEAEVLSTNALGGSAAPIVSTSAEELETSEP